ncbi:leucyl aminopeptidase [Clostridium sp. MCC353]|uniref:aminopeptidase n=1 Tax=Clostridium sp. MCC353 TaxID=2592646 RepID=UPI001C012390|nr:aminopeptidase [Clostridium sp. MCC353]MBT9779156.1 leucyl aminopeptidase [Clostridium sp. MCC353]
MDYRVLLKEENEAVMERYELSMERIREMEGEDTVSLPYREYFKRTADFILMIGKLVEELNRGMLKEAPFEELKSWNRRLYQDIEEGTYEKSFANPAYAVKMLGDGVGQLLSFLYAEIRGDIVFAYENRLGDITILNELFIEIYNMFEEGIPQAKKIKDALYWFINDYADQMISYRMRESLDPGFSFAVDIIMNENLNDLRYLYHFGEQITDNELKTAGFLNSLPQETIELMAHTYTEGYRKGFEVMGRDLSGKKNVAIRYELGFERMVKQAVINFRNMGLEPVIYRAAVQTLNKNPNRKVGYYSASGNKQYEYDHRYDGAVYLTGTFKNKRKDILRSSYEALKKEASLFAGPAVIETFGENGFEPVNKPEAFGLSKKQEQLTIAYANESMQISNEYMPGDETSFTIIAFPIPAIGKDFEDIFKETIRINTLDYEVYKGIQQVIIDVLDRAAGVRIKGSGGNETQLFVALHELECPDKQTNFENCVADVNIPLGEVFTSPVLKGTEGILHVENVYIGDIQFKNLRLTFENGMVTDYGCGNFEKEEEGKRLVKQVILKNHDSVPMGEFAIGTNTTAYAMAKKFGIIDKLPILIVEKMGPHFAVGDTCYSWSEDSPVYNPDGKEIIARDNEISLLRKEDVSKAYFNCHTDITIPYDELDYIEAVDRKGNAVRIIENGRFVLPGLEELNRAF